MKKRGLSTIVATLIVILLVLVAVAIVWTVLRNLIQKSTEEITLSKLTIDLKIDSVRITNDSASVKVKRNPGEGDIKGISFIIFDGFNTKIIEKTGITLEPLERKTFVLNYTGSIVKISIAPMFETESGKLKTGSITDTYYIKGAIENSENQSECTPDCGTRQCGIVPNGCGISCGSCSPEEPNCQEGVCTSEACIANCSCASKICIGQVCTGGCGEACPGELTLEQDCGSTMCGNSPSGCGNCGDCEEGYRCDSGICVVSCIPDCGTLECGPVPNGCTESCGTCNTTAGEWCNNGSCSSESCEPDCGTKNCGPVPNGCTESCGTCNATAGEYCSSEGICVLENYLNTGEIYSVWPINIGIYFDSSNLPTEGVDYSNYYVKFTTGSEIRCLQIREFVTPVIPDVYNMSYIRFVTSSSEIKSGDTYQIWKTYAGCTS
jgi:hypothetical protein